jgi:hypothetical protein
MEANNEIKVGSMVTVEGTKAGIVRYLTPDGYLGIEILGERGRVDEWPAESVKV